MWKHRPFKTKTKQSLKIYLSRETSSSSIVSAFTLLFNKLGLSWNYAIKCDCGADKIERMNEGAKQRVRLLTEDRAQKLFFCQNANVANYFNFCLG